MSDRTLQAQITAVDKASPVFRQVATGAEKMGQSIDQSAQKAGRSTEDLTKRMAALGAGLTAGAALLGQWSRSAQDAEAIQRQLEASIAATGESFDQYADQIEAAGEAAVQMGFDDEAAMQAISALTQITGSAGVAINEMGLVMDLAAAKSMSLESAAELVGKVHEGNTGILQRYGIAVEEGATAEEALAQIQQQVAGQAEAHATTYARLREELSNLTDSIGGAVDGFAPMLALLPGISSGFTLAGSAIGALAPNLTKAGAATAALNLALGPVGLVAALGAAAVAGKALSDWLDHGYTEAVRAATAASSDLVDTINQLASAGDPTAQVGAEMRANFIGTAAVLADLEGAIEALRVGLIQARAQHKDESIIAQMEASKAALEALEDQYGGTSDATREYAETLAALDAILAHTGPGHDAILRRAQALADTFAQEGIPGAKAYGDAIQELAAQMGVYDQQATEAAEATASYWKVFNRLVTTGKDWKNLDIKTVLQSARDSTEANAFSLGNMAEKASAGSDAIAEQTDLLAMQAAKTDQVTARWQEYDEKVRAAAEADRLKAKANRELLDSMSVQANAEADQLDRNKQKWDEYDSAVRAANDSRVQSSQDAADYVAQLERERAAVMGYAQALGVLDTYAKQLRGYDLGPLGGDRAKGTAAILQQTGGALDAILGTFKQIDQMGQATGEAASIAEQLVGKPGEVAQIDRLLEQGRISQTRYNMTVEAGYDIMKRQEGIERDLQVIRAKQLPLLNEQDQAYARTIDKLSHLSAEQQQVALGFMDSNEAMKAQQAAALATSAAMGELGENGEATATKIIEGAVAADPVLASMLESIGLISRDHEGNLVVNFPEGESLTETVQGLTDSIDALTTALGGVPPNTEASLDVSQSGPGALEIGAIEAALHSLDGTNATSYITTVNRTIGFTPDVARDGGVLGYRNGGMVLAELAEDGPERLRFRNGGTAIVASRGIYAVERGTYVTPTAATMASTTTAAGQVVFNNYGAIHGFADLDAFFAAGAAAARRHLGGGF